MQMKDITCQMIEGTKLLTMAWDRIEWNRAGYWLDDIFVGDLEAAFYDAGKTTKRRRDNAV